MRALVIGEGLIGTALKERLRALGHEVIGTTRRRNKVSKHLVHLDLDLESFISTDLTEIDVAYFCAAMTKYDKCRDDEPMARRINATNPAAIARSLVDSHARVVLLSTSAVLDCRSPCMKEDRPRHPASVYGRTKAEAEVAFLDLGRMATVLRLTKVLIPGDERIGSWISKLARGEEFDCAGDFRISPIALEHVVQALVSISDQQEGGIFQVSAASDISYAELAWHIADQLHVSRQPARSRPSASLGIPSDTVTAYTSLDTARLALISSFVPPDPQDVIDSVMGYVIAVARNSTSVRAGT